MSYEKTEKTDLETIAAIGEGIGALLRETAGRSESTRKLYEAVFGEAIDLTGSDDESDAEGTVDFGEYDEATVVSGTGEIPSPDLSAFTTNFADLRCGPVLAVGGIPPPLPPTPPPQPARRNPPPVRRRRPGVMQVGPRLPLRRGLAMRRLVLPPRAVPVKPAPRRSARKSPQTDFYRPVNE